MGRVRFGMAPGAECWGFILARVIGKIKFSQPSTGTMWPVVVLYLIK